MAYEVLLSSGVETLGVDVSNLWNLGVDVRMFGVESVKEIGRRGVMDAVLRRERFD